MCMFLRVILFSTCFLLTACTLPTAPKPEENSSGTGNVMAESGAVVLEEGAAPAEEVEKQEHRERLLGNGILEIGKAGSGLTLRIFAEHHAAYSKEFAEEQLPRLLSEFVATDQLKLQIVILPLQKYAGSVESAKALYCAGKQEQGLPMHQLLFAKPDALKENAETLKLDVPAFETCLRSDDATAKVQMQKDLAAQSETTLIPTFFLDDQKFVGLPYYADLQGRIERALE